MSNVITDVREAIQAHLATVFPPPAQVVGGRLDGVNHDPFAKICLWHPGIDVVQSSRTLAKPTLLLRHFPPLSKQPSATAPRDQGALEQAEIDLLGAFADKNRAGDFVANVAVAVSRSTLNDDAARWYVELTLAALMLNIAQPAA